MPMDPMQAAQPDESGGQPDQSTLAGKPGYLLCIHVGGDGQISVGVESDQEEQAEGEEPTGEADGAAEGDYTPVNSFEEAMAMAKSIYRNGGKMQDQPDMAAAKAGYAKRATGRQQMQAPNPAGIFGEE